jgi:hypothetical protein
MRAGATAFYIKPLQPSVLRACVSTLLERGAVGSLCAKVEEQQVIYEELRRRAAVLAERTEAARQSAAGAIERAARIKAARAFLHSGGTHAELERWWPQVFSSAKAGFSAERE